MMTENRSDSEGPWGVLNDWDHALWIDAAPTDRIVRIPSSRLDHLVTSYLGDVAIYIYRITSRYCQTTQHLRRLGITALGPPLPGCTLL